VDESLPRPFGKYILLSRLPAGGMAEVFLALQRSSWAFEKFVVVKRILPAKSQDPAFIEMFLREARIAATLSHPNVVQTFDAGELDGRHFLVMEHVHGEDLRTILRTFKSKGGAAPPLEHALGVVLGVCSGLAYVHEKRDWGGAHLGIVHCDVSTRNVVVSFAGDVKIVDFGIATTDLDEVSEPDRREVRRQVKGKARYMSPEQAAGEALDARADIFSLGVILFELTTGQRCFPGAEKGAMPSPTHNTLSLRPSEVVPGYPPALEQIVMRSLSERRSDRYSSVRPMAADLEEFMGSEGITLSPGALGAWMHTLFEEKIAQDEAFLRGAGEIVAAMDAEQKRTSAEAQLGGLGSIAPQAMSVPQPRRWSLGGAALPVASAVAAIGAMFYLQHDMAARVAAAVRIARDQQVGSSQPAAAPEATGTLEIASKPEGCTIWVNGDERTETTPAKLERLALERELHVKLAKAGFEPYRTVVKLAADAPFKDLDVQMRKLPATVLLQVDRRVSFNLWVDGTLWKDHSKVEGLSPDEEHILGFISPGYASKSVRLTLQPGETRSLDVRLMRTSPAHPAGEEPPSP
jgi:eukaryotic-like serine/threonine-protein kinase